MASAPAPPANAPASPPLAAPGVREVKLHRDDTSVSFGFALASQKNGDKIVVTVRTNPLELKRTLHSTRQPTPARAHTSFV